MRWSEFAAAQPVLAAVASDQLIKPGVVLAGTTRKDGPARISGVEPLLMDGELWLSMMPASAKARDLYRDPRIVVHTIVTSPSPEAGIMMRGTVGPRPSLMCSGVTPRPSGLTSAGGRCRANSRCSALTLTTSLSSGTTLRATPSMSPAWKSTCALP